MADPTAAEVNRRLDDKFGEVREDLANLGRRVDGKVSQDVYQLQHTSLLSQIADLKAENAALRAERAQDAARVAATRRWLIGAVIVPIVAVLLAYMLSRGGAA